MFSTSKILSLSYFIIQLLIVEFSLFMCPPETDPQDILNVAG
jgi:hypothetical protein